MESANKKQLKTLLQCFCRPQKPAAGRHAEAGLAADATPCPDRAGEGDAEAAGLEETARDVRGAGNAIPGRWSAANFHSELSASQLRIGQATHTERGAPSVTRFSGFVMFFHVSCEGLPGQ